jgi:hypothetical protein
MSADEWVGKLARAWAAAGAPLHLLDGFTLWVVAGVPPGHHQLAVLRNDLSESVATADSTSLAGLIATVQALHSAAPSQSWGSRARCSAWCQHGGLRGLQAARDGSDTV